MKASNNNTILKTIIGSVLTISISLFIVSFTVKNITGDVLKSLGIDSKTLDSRIASSLIYGYLDHGNINKLKMKAAGERLELLKDLCRYMKNYTTGEDFKDGYQLFREKSMPQKPELVTTDAALIEQINNYKKSIAETEANLKDASLEIKEIINEGLTTLKSQLKDLENPKSDIAKIIVQGTELNNRNAMDRYMEDLKEWEDNFPADHDEFLKSRLHLFLEFTDSIDFSAELKEGYNGKKRFVNPQFESKPAEWKKAFRAGKEATESARAFARQWLNELQ
ncbi:hypothetical protein BH23BAC1_BH23BAC1_36080 [soil metagenome]